MADFDFQGLLGNMFGGGESGSELEKLLSAKQREQLGLQSTLSAAAALLKAGGRGPQRIGLGQALGSALEAGQGAYERGTANAFQQMLLGQKLQEGARLNEYQKALVGAPAVAVPSAADQAMAAPVSQVGMGPSPRRAELMNQIEAKAPTADEKRFAELMRKADVANAYNRPDDADKYLKQAYTIKPQEEFSTTPNFGMSATGTPISYVLSKTGGMRLLNVQRNPEYHYADTGAFISVRDKTTNKELEQIPKSMTPGEKASNWIAQQNLGLAQGNYARGAYDVKETQDGFAYIPKVPGGAAVPVMGAAGTQLTGAKEAPADYSKAVRKLNDLSGNLSSYKSEIESNKTVFPSEVPLPFGAKIPLPTGSDTARVRGKYQSLLMGVKDLYDLGALTGPDMGIINQQLTNPASFAGVFTSRNAMMEQIGVLEDMLQRSEQNLSSTYNRKMPQPSAAGLTSPKSTTPSMVPGAPVWDPVKKQYVFQ